MFETVTIDQEFVTLDLALWRRFRTEVGGRVERHIDLNPHICDHVFLPVGTVLTIEVDSSKTTTAASVVSLWS